MYEPDISFQVFGVLLLLFCCTVPGTGRMGFAVSSTELIDPLLCNLRGIFVGRAFSATPSSRRKPLGRRSPGVTTQRYCERAHDTWYTDVVITSTRLYINTQTSTRTYNMGARAIWPNQNLVHPNVQDIDINLVRHLHHTQFGCSLVTGSG